MKSFLEHKIIVLSHLTLSEAWPFLASGGSGSAHIDFLYDNDIECTWLEPRQTLGLGQNFDMEPAVSNTSAKLRLKFM